jgi:hypothetical protein
MRNTIFNQPVLLLKLVASVMYISMGLLVALWPQAFGDMLAGITPTLVKTFAALLIVYGIYRLYRVIQDLNSLNQQRSDDEA